MILEEYNWIYVRFHKFQVRFTKYRCLASINKSIDSAIIQNLTNGNAGTCHSNFRWESFFPARIRHRKKSNLQSKIASQRELFCTNLNNHNINIFHLCARRRQTNRRSLPSRSSSTHGTSKLDQIAGSSATLAPRRRRSEPMATANRAPHGSWLHCRKAFLDDRAESGFAGWLVGMFNTWV